MYKIINLYTYHINFYAIANCTAMFEDRTRNDPILSLSLLLRFFMQKERSFHRISKMCIALIVKYFYYDTILKILYSNNKVIKINIFLFAMLNLEDLF